MMRRLLVIPILILSISLSACGSSGSVTPASSQVEDVAETKSENISEDNEEIVQEDTAELIENALKEGVDYYYAQNGKTVDNDAAMAAFQTAADLGSDIGYYYIGRIHDRKEEYAEAVAAYEQAVGEGNSMAKLALGMSYLHGDGVEEDYEKARQLFEEAMAEGCVEANNGLGDIYQNGYGEDADGNKAIDYFTQAAKGAETEWIAYAYVSISSMYSGYYDDVEKDKEKVVEYAERYLSLAEPYEAADAYYFLGATYSVPVEDPSTGMEYHIKAADLGNDAAMNLIGYMYEHGEGVEQDYAAAVDWYTKAADLGNSLAMNNIGNMYENGKGVEQDYAAALDWYTKAADLGSSAAMFNIGYMYEYGEGVEQDYAVALEWFTKAADLGDSSAMNNIGVMYVKGNGVDVNYDTALEWLIKSAELGHETAIENIRWMVNQGYISKEDAADWL